MRHSSFRPVFIGTFALVAFAASACSTPESDSAEPANVAPTTHAPVAALIPAPSTDPADSMLFTVYKTATCGCCQKWVDYIKAEGYRVAVHDVTDLQAVKTTHGITDDLQSCHTAVVNGYLIEGHVPIEDVKRMLKDRPQIAGIAAPGMPMGSPGMEGPVKDKYDIIAFGKDGTRKVYAKH
jgi:hypothetical protein